jgi:hypothetical protein
MKIRLVEAELFDATGGQMKLKVAFRNFTKPRKKQYHVTNTDPPPPPTHTHTPKQPLPKDMPMRRRKTVKNILLLSLNFVNSS